jgi:HEAT repeat protein
MALRPIPLIAVVVLLFVSGRPAVAGDAQETARLAAVLQSAAVTADKAQACQRLAEVGTAEAVPALASLLADEHLSAYARTGLEAIPDPSAAEALCAALTTLKGAQLVGAINSRRTACCRGGAQPVPDGP